MSETNDEIERRRAVALEAIKKVHGTEHDSHGATLFVSHHIEEIEADYWKEHCGVARPTPQQVLNLLVLSSHWSEDEEEEEDEEGMDTFDFTLPGDVTDYVISVLFDEDGNVEEITMES